MDTPKSCIICYKSIINPSYHLNSSANKNEHNECWTNTGQNILITFFSSLKRHLSESGSLVGGGTQIMRFPIEHLIQSGMYSCEDCLGQLESFCQLYHQIKSTELLLSWKMSLLMNIMSCAQRVPSRLSQFRDMIEKLELQDITADEIIDFKSDLIKNCEKKCRDSYPKLQVRNCRTNGGGEMNQDKNPKTTSLSFVSEENKIDISEATYGSNDDDGNTNEETHLLKSDDVPGIEVSNVKVEPFPNSTSQLYALNNNAQLGFHDSCSAGASTDEKSTTAAKFTEVKSGARRKLHKLRIGRPFLFKYPPPIKLYSKSIQEVGKLLKIANPNTGKFRCNICHTEFVNFHKCRAHYDSLHLQIKYRCRYTHCTKQFGRVDQYNEHVRGAHMNFYKCGVCSQMFANNQMLSYHRKNAHGAKLCVNPKYRNRHCMIRGSLKREPKDMERLEKPEKHDIPDNLNDPVPSSITLTTYHNTNRNRCKFCSAEFVHPSSLSTHKLICQMRKLCSTPTPQLAKDCAPAISRIANSENLSISDMAGAGLPNISPSMPSNTSCTRENVDNPMNCSGNIILEKQSSSTTELQRSNEEAYNKMRKKYKCKICEKSFTLSTHLKRHFKSVHLKLKEHTCTQCGMKFARKDNLDDHRRRKHP